MEKTDPVYRTLAQTLAWKPNEEWSACKESRIRSIMETAPSGSGWDNGTTLDEDASHGDRLVFHGSYHHMNDGGYYDGWTDHSIIVKPSLAYGLDIRITGRNHNDIKEYLFQTFYEWLLATCIVSYDRATCTHSVILKGW